MLRRQRRYAFGAAPTGRSPLVRAGMMLGMLLVLGMLIGRASDPSVWRWLADEPAPPPAGEAPQPAAALAASAAETIVSGPHDDDPAERRTADREFSAVSDRDGLGAEEMPAYWRLLNWSQAQKFAELASRGRTDVLYTQLWERPTRHRGELLRLRLHVVRVLAHEAPENKAGLKELYEIWGWTDDSKSFPYVAIVSELPPGLTVGADVRHEVTFAGYFLKLLAYEAFDKSRAAPLLLGRAERFGDLPPPAERREENAQEFLLVFVLGAFGLVGALVGGAIAARRRSRARAVTHAATNTAAELRLPSWDDPPHRPEAEFDPSSDCDRFTTTVSNGHAASPRFPS
jgi:hypothetical protein